VADVAVNALHAASSEEAVSDDRVSRYTAPVLALVPSQGLGGGIETYVDGVLSSCRGLGLDVAVIALRSPAAPTGSLLGRLSFVLAASRRVLSRRQERPKIVLVFHPLLGPIAVLLDLLRRRSRPRPVIFFYGAEIWSLAAWKRRVIRRAGLQIVTISTFSAGALTGIGLDIAHVLPPRIDKQRFRVLGAACRERGLVDIPSPVVLSVFRLSDVEAKGGLVLVEAAERIVARHPGLRLVIAGSGTAPDALKTLADSRPWLEVCESPSLESLADLYRRATLFALATRTKAMQRAASGEGFGIVLAEAQLTGAPVIVPATGGSADAYVEGYTGYRVNDESAASLANAMEKLLGEPETLLSMSRNAASWSRKTFSPNSSSADLLSVLGLDRPPEVVRGE
jgi:glycosyltransferase involved in cell wall biosynthesis